MAKKEKEYSGKFVIRISPEIHKELTEMAIEKDFSLNGLIKNILKKEVKKSEKRFV